KICSLYGEGFYYIPGTDICLKIGGYVRADYGWNAAGSGQPHYTGANGAQDRTVNPYSSRHRAHFNFDSRTQTAYGSLRTYVAVNIENRDLNSVTVSPTRAFIRGRASRSVTPSRTPTCRARARTLTNRCSRPRTPAIRLPTAPTRS